MIIEEKRINSFFPCCVSHEEEIQLPALTQNIQSRRRVMERLGLDGRQSPGQMNGVYCMSAQQPETNIFRRLLLVVAHSTNPVTARRSQHPSLLTHASSPPQALVAAPRLAAAPTPASAWPARPRPAAGRFRGPARRPGCIRARPRGALTTKSGVRPGTRGARSITLTGDRGSWTGPVLSSSLSHRCQRRAFRTCAP